MQRKARITGMGTYLPERVLTNADLEKMVETSDEWIVQRTGVKERRIAGPEEASSHMGAAAGRKALAAAGVAVEEIDLILVATMTPDYIGANTACLVQQQLGAFQAAAVDLQAACTGHIYGLSVAKAFIESGIYKTILFISTEKMTSLVDYTDRRTCILFGDGAAAKVIQANRPGFQLDELSLGADGAEHQLLYIPGGGSRHPASPATLEARMHYIHMEGQAVFKHAVRRMTMAIEEVLKLSQATPESIRWVVPHQANQRIVDATVKRVSIDPERVYCQCVERYGNQSSASVAIAFYEMLQERPVEHGDRILMVAFGAGFTWGAMLLTKVDE